MKDYDWQKIAGAETHEDFGSDVVRAVAAAMQKAYVMGVADAVKAIDDTSVTPSDHEPTPLRAAITMRLALRRAVAALIDHAPETWLGRKYTDLRTLFDQLVTRTKLSGSMATMKGHTEPEGWPFAVIVIVDKTADKRLAALVTELDGKVTSLGPEFVSEKSAKPWP